MEVLSRMQGVSCKHRHADALRLCRLQSESLVATCCTNARVSWPLITHVRRILVRVPTWTPKVCKVTAFGPVLKVLGHYFRIHAVFGAP